MSDTKMDLGRLRIDRSATPVGPRRSRSRRGLWVALAIVLAAAVPIVLWAMNRAPSVTTAMAEFRGAGGGGGVGLTANGYVVARKKASISSKVSGRLESLAVSEGSLVAADEVIATLENADYRAALRQAEAQLAVSRATRIEVIATRDQLRRDVRRGAELVADSLISTQGFEQLESSLTEVEARLASQEARILADAAAVDVARANLENTLIRAPFAGTVLRKDAEVGELVAPTNGGGGLTRGAVVTMADLQSLEVEVDVNESYIARVTAGQTARIILDAYPTVTFPGEVRQIMPTADRQRATVQVKVAIVERDPRILPEMGARVEFLETAETPVASETPRVVVPADAVREDGGASIVWVVRDGRVERRAIQAGPVSGAVREVRSGLSGGEQLVLSGPARLTDGMKVKVAAAS